MSSSKRGWLSDARYAEQAIRAKARRFGPLKVTHQLRARGLGRGNHRCRLPRRGRRWCVQHGIRLAQPLPRNAADAREHARQARFLQGRGFPLEEVLRFLKIMEKSTMNYRMQNTLTLLALVALFVVNALLKG